MQMTFVTKPNVLKRRAGTQAFKQARVVSEDLVLAFSNKTNIRLDKFPHLAASE